MYATRRCFDRGFKLSDDAGLGHTLKVIQEDYEDVNTGNELFMEYRYCNMLTMLSVCFTYSAGMPILYPIAGLYFFISYWVEKLLILRFYKKPPVFNSHLAKNVTSWFKIILYIHIFMAYLMFSNTQIMLSTEDTSRSDEIVTESLSDSVECVNRFCGRSFTQLHMDLFFVLMLLIFIGYLCWRCIILVTYRCIKRCFCKSDDLIIARDKDAREDFYRCIDFKTLRNEYISVLQNLSLFRKMKKKWPTLADKSSITEQQIDLYIVEIDNKRKAIKVLIKEIAAGKLDPSVKRVPEMIEKLDQLHKSGDLANSVIKEELKSYDIM
jgi:hypothetical protein